MEELTLDQQHRLDELAKEGNEYAEAVKVLVSWGAGDRCAKDDRTDIEDALELLDVVSQDNLILYRYWFEIDEGEKKEWLSDWEKEYGLNWDDEDELYQAWQSVVESHNADELAKIAKKEFEERFGVRTGDFDEHYVIDVPHTGKVKWWRCESFWTTAINDGDIDYQIFNDIEDAQEFYYGEEIPAQLREMLIAGRKVIGVNREGGEMEFYFADEFDKEEYARDYYRSDLSGMIILDSFEDAYWELQHRSGHQAAGIKSACEEIIEHNA